jgi:hypothetical protein
MPSTISNRGRARRGVRRFVAGGGVPRPVTPISAVSVAVTAEAIAFTFNQPVILDGVPQYLTDVAGALPISAARTSPTVVTVTYGAFVDGGTKVTIPFEDPAVRNASGGFVCPAVMSY